MMETIEQHLAFRKQRAEAYSTCFGDFETGYNGAPATNQSPRIDVFVYPPGPGNRPFYTLITNGMSDRRMNTPASSPSRPRAEIVLYAKSPKKEYLDWIYWTAQFPFIDNTYLDITHRIPWHEPLFSGSTLSSMLMLDTLVRSDRQIEDTLFVESDPVRLLWWVPISLAEYELSRTSGLSALLDLFERFKHPVEIDEYRRSYV